MAGTQQESLTKGESHKQRMAAGETYCYADPELVADKMKASEWMARYNATMAMSPEERLPLLAEALGTVGNECEVRPPFCCDFGFNIHLGEKVFLNFNCVVLDGGPVRIGDNTQIGPGVQLCTPDHPRDHAERHEMMKQSTEIAYPVTIGKNVWIGAGALVLPGVTVGDDCVIGAGSVVTRDVPPGAIAMGNPARVKAAN